VKILHQDIQNANGFPAHPCNHLLMGPDDDNQMLFGHHLVHGDHAAGWICDCGSEAKSAQFAQLQARILHQDIQNANGFPAHLCHHHLISPDSDNQWLFGHHLAH
jgi:hypothetical protein